MKQPSRGVLRKICRTPFYKNTSGGLLRQCDSPELNRNSTIRPLWFWVSFSLYKTIFSIATNFINALPSNRNNDRVAFSKTAPEVWYLWILHFLKERNNSFKRTYHILGCLLDPTLGYGWIVKMEVIWYAAFYSNH